MPPAPSGATASRTTRAAVSPPARTKSPMDRTSWTRVRTRSSMPLSPPHNRTPLGAPVVGAAAVGGEQDDPGRALGLQVVEGVEPGPGGHDHAGPAAEGGVVDAAVAVGGPVAQVVEADLDQAPLPRPAEQAGGQGRGEEPGEDGDDVDQHRLSPDPPGHPPGVPRTPPGRAGRG